MTDRIYLSLWLHRHLNPSPLAALDRILERFPVSQFTPTVVLRIFALELVEPAVFDREFEDPQVDEIIAAARDFDNPDCAYEVTLHWDLWQRRLDELPAGLRPSDPTTPESDWTLGPSPVRIVAFGPDFESDLGEQVSFELGHDFLYLPGDTLQPNFTALRSNIRSILRLANDLEENLPVASRTLWSDAEDDLADRLDDVLTS